MMTLWMSIVLFLPVFLAVNLVASLPGHADIKAALRTGVRHFVVGTVIILVGSAILHFLMVWLLGRGPLW